MFSSLYSVLSDLAAEYPKTFGAITSAISVGGILAAGWAYWSAQSSTRGSVKMKAPTG
jgi:hypothetical protein